jgi:hypothetical protein
MGGTGALPTLIGCRAQSNGRRALCFSAPSGLRGNRIEQIITEAGNFHRLDDLVFPLRGRSRALVDIKTKVLTLQSNPKGFNIDKYLRTLAEGHTVISFFFVGVNPSAGVVRTGFASTLDETVIDATHVQFH